MRYYVAIAIAIAIAIGGFASAGQPTKRPTDAQRGKELYDRHCVQCHGSSNLGDGPATTALVHEVPNLQGQTATDDAAVKIVVRGKNAMPGFETSFDSADATRVLRHMAGLGSTPAALRTTPEVPEEGDKVAEDANAMGDQGEQGDQGDEGDAQNPSNE